MSAELHFLAVNVIINQVYSVALIIKYTNTLFNTSMSNKTT